MHTFLTPDPVTLEIRNAAGDIRVLLSDTPTTTVEVTPTTSSPLGFLDDVLKSFGGGRGRQLGRLTAMFGDQPRTTEGSSDDRQEAGPATDDLAASVRVEHRSGENVVEVDTHAARDGWRSSFTITVTAPVQSNIRVKSQSSNIRVTGRAGRVDARTAAGDVMLDDISGKALVQTASGNVGVVAADADVDVRTASGNVLIGPVGGDALVHSTSGEIAVGAVAGDISARSVSGDVRVADAAVGRADVTAVSGDVRIGVHAGALASVDLTTVSGSTDTEFEVISQIPDGDSPVLHITVKTTSGDIHLHSAA